MTSHDALAREFARVEALIDRLERPGADAGPARELVALILDLHGAGLARLLEHVAACTGGAALLARLLEDDRVRAMLLLHDLHPDSLETRLQRCIDTLHPHLGVRGLRVAEWNLDADALYIRLAGGDANAARHGKAIRSEIETALYDAAPDLGELTLEGLPQPGSVAVIDLSRLHRPRSGESEAPAAP